MEQHTIYSRRSRYCENRRAKGSDDGNNDDDVSKSARDPRLRQMRSTKLITYVRHITALTLQVGFETLHHSYPQKDSAAVT